MENDEYDYENFLDIDDNDIFIRKYSDDNIPIYNKRLSPSPDLIKEHEEYYHQPLVKRPYMVSVSYKKCVVYTQFTGIIIMVILCVLYYYHLIHYY